MKFKLTKVDSLIRKRLLSINKETFIFLLCTTLFSFTTENAFSQEKLKIEKVLSLDEVYTIIRKQTDRKGRVAVACSTFNSVVGKPSSDEININTIGLSTNVNSSPINTILKNNNSYIFKISFLTLLMLPEVLNQSNRQNTFNFFSRQSFVFLTTNTLEQIILKLPFTDISRVYLNGQVKNSSTKSELSTNAVRNYYMVEDSLT